jgi:hypothetical protein
VDGTAWIRHEFASEVSNNTSFTLVFGSAAAIGSVFVGVTLNTGVDPHRLDISQGESGIVKFVYGVERLDGWNYAETALSLKVLQDGAYFRLVAGTGSWRSLDGLAWTQDKPPALMYGDPFKTVWNGTSLTQVGDNGFVVAVSDDGRTWRGDYSILPFKVEVKTPQEPVGKAFGNINFCVTYKGYSALTFDGGATWVLKDFG